jgi:hypothetical protein
LVYTTFTFQEGRTENKNLTKSRRAKISQKPPHRDELGLATTSWRWLALAAALGAAGVGVSAIVRNAHADHFEGFVLLIGTAFCVQAALALWVLAFRPRTERA